MKSHVACDGPEMRAVYSLAAEMNVPVLIHFADFPQFEGEGTWNGGIARFPAVVKANPKTVFIGHGDGFWANTSADVPDGVPYPTGRIKPGGVSDRMLSEYPNFYGDFSANSGRNFLARDPDFAAKFVERHRAKLKRHRKVLVDNVVRRQGPFETRPEIEASNHAAKIVDVLLPQETPEPLRRLRENPLVVARERRIDDLEQEPPCPVNASQPGSTGSIRLSSGLASSTSSGRPSRLARGSALSGSPGVGCHADASPGRPASSSSSYVIDLPDGWRA
jgi:hypothetical protein